MDRMRGAFFYFICAAMVFLPALSSAGVKVMLKNGREVIADTCEAEGDRLVCTKMGGTFDLEKKDVESMKQTSGGEEAAPAVEPAENQPAEQEKKAEGAQGADRAGKEAGDSKRLAEIRQKKKDLFTEREKLVKERQQFQEDLKKAPDWMSTKQYDELNKRNTEITEKIKRFNEEAERLSEEEKRITEGQKKNGVFTAVDISKAREFFNISSPQRISGAASARGINENSSDCL